MLRQLYQDTDMPEMVILRVQVWTSGVTGTVGIGVHPRFEPLPFIKYDFRHASFAAYEWVLGLGPDSCLICFDDTK